jgi:ABC-type sugar transport system permease subunit
MMLILLAGLQGQPRDPLEVVQNFDAVFTITSGGLGTENLPYSVYDTCSPRRTTGRRRRRA